MQTAILLFALVIALSLVGCQQTSDDYPRDLQSRLAHLLDQPTQCTSGTSADVRALVNTAGPEG
jgi:outer membrane lipoprotein SlyB